MRPLFFLLLLALVGCPPTLSTGSDDDDTAADDDDTADDDDATSDDDDSDPTDDCGEYTATLVAPTSDTHPSSEPLAVTFSPTIPPDVWTGLRQGNQYVVGGENWWKGNTLFLERDLVPGAEYFFEGGWVCFLPDGTDVDQVLFEVYFEAI